MFTPSALWTASSMPMAWISGLIAERAAWSKCRRELCTWGGYMARVLCVKPDTCHPCKSGHMALLALSGTYLPISDVWCVHDKRLGGRKA